MALERGEEGWMVPGRRNGSTECLETWRGLTGHASEDGGGGRDTCEGRW